MNKLNLVFAPNPIYSKISEKIENIDNDIKSFADKMVEFLKDNHAYGLAAPMFGVSKRIIVVDSKIEAIVMINPEIIYKSEDKNSITEQSLSFPNIEVEVNRSTAIKVEFLDLNNEKKQIEASGIFARCIQHEIDYLDGVTILNYVSKLKRDMLIKKMQKYNRLGIKPHIHTNACNH